MYNTTPDNRIDMIDRVDDDGVRCEWDKQMDVISYYSCSLESKSDRSTTTIEKHYGMVGDETSREFVGKCCITNEHVISKAECNGACVVTVVNCLSCQLNSRRRYYLREIKLSFKQDGSEILRIMAIEKKLFVNERKRQQTDTFNHAESENVRMGWVALEKVDIQIVPDGEHVYDTRTCLCKVYRMVIVFTQLML